MAIPERERERGGEGKSNDKCVPICQSQWESENRWLGRLAIQYRLVALPLRQWLRMRFSPIAENPTLLLKNSLLLLKRTGSELSASSNVCLLTTIGDFRIIFRFGFMAIWLQCCWCCNGNGARATGTKRLFIFRRIRSAFAAEQHSEISQSNHLVIALNSRNENRQQFTHAVWTESHLSPPPAKKKKIVAKRIKPCLRKRRSM